MTSGASHSTPPDRLRSARTLLAAETLMVSLAPETDQVIPEQVPMSQCFTAHPKAAPHLVTRLIPLSASA